MEDKYYLRVQNGTFGFVIEGIHEIVGTDIEVTIEDYNQFFKMQNEGKQFRLKATSTGDGLFDFVEEYVPEQIIIHQNPTTEERLAALEAALMGVI